MTSDRESSRLPASERRSQILAAATAVFGARGYIGATTDQVARAAGISQPYVVRLFGSKEALFLAVVTAAKDAVLTSFRETLMAARAAGADEQAVAAALGERYIDLAETEGLHLALMQAFVQGADPVIGAAARSGYLEIWRFVREEAGLDPAAAGNFLAQGMLISVILGLELPRIADDPTAHELLQIACGDKLGVLLPPT